MTATFQVLSFDVFDTTVTRLVGHPTSLFYLQGHCLRSRGEWRLGVADFARARIDAEARAREHDGRPEVSLEDIYRELAHAFDIDQRRQQEWMRLELQIEVELLRPVAGMVDRVRSARAELKRVLFVSDTYLSNVDLRSWLLTLGVATPTDRVWASSSAGATKASGELFQHVLRTEEIAPPSVLHVGDNVIADVRSPAALGIASEWFEAGTLTSRERQIEEFSSSTGGIASLMSGASRYVRLSMPTRSGDEQTLRDIAAQVAGPILSAYVLWVMYSAASLGISRLLFVARDGEILMRMAKEFARKLGMDFEMRYVYANRQVVNLASLERVDSAAIEWITDGLVGCDLAEILQRVGLTVAQIPPEALCEIPIAGPLGASALIAVHEMLSQPIVAKLVIKSARESRVRTRRYFESVGLMDDAPAAIIDIGWKGRVFKSLANLIGAKPAAKHTAFYFGLFDRPSVEPPLPQRAYLFDVNGRATVGSGYDILCLPQVMEIFTQAAHGQVLGIGQGKDGFVPILASPNNDVGPKWRVEYFQNCVAAFAEALAIDPRWCEALPDLRPMCERLLRSFTSSPTLAEAGMIGNFCYRDGQNGAAAKFAEPYRISEVIRQIHSRQSVRQGRNQWDAGSAALTDPAVMKAMKLAKRASHRIFRMRGQLSAAARFGR